MELPHDPAVTLLGMGPREANPHVHANTCTSIFTAAPFLLAQKWHQPKCPLVTGWVKKWWDIRAMDYYSAVRREEARTHATTCTNLENSMPSARSQAQKAVTLFKGKGNPERQKVGEWSLRQGRRVGNRGGWQRVQGFFVR